jgi:hypothetical protein
MSYGSCVGTFSLVVTNGSSTGKSSLTLFVKVHTSTVQRATDNTLACWPGQTSLLIRTLLELYYCIETRECLHTANRQSDRGHG